MLNSNCCIKENRCDFNEGVPRSLELLPSTQTRLSWHESTLTSHQTTAHLLRGLWPSKYRPRPGYLYIIARKEIGEKSVA